MTERSVKKYFMSPRSKQDNEIIKQKRREQIIRHALEIFAKRGYHRTSVSDIARAAGISKGLMYNYFESKEDLLITVLEYVMQQAMDMIFNSIAEKSESLSPRELMAFGIERFFEVMQAQAGMWKLSMSLGMQVADMPKVHRVFVQMYHMTFQQIEQMLRAADVPDASVKARIIAAQLDGIAMHYFVMGDNYDLSAVKKAFIHELVS